MPLYLENFGRVNDSILTLNNGATIVNTDVDTLTITETNIVLESNTTITGDLTINGGDINATTPSENVNIFATTTGKLTLGGGHVDIGANGSTTTIKGHLLVEGTTTTISSTTHHIDDPVLELGSTTVTSTDGFDRGLKIFYGDGSVVQEAFIGWDRTEDKFTFRAAADADGDNGPFTGGYGNAKFAGLTLTETFTVVGTGATTLGGTLEVTGATTLNDNVVIASDKTFTVGTGATTLGGTLVVTGATTLNDNVVIASDKTLTVAGTGATTLGGTLEVTGATTFTHKTLTVGGTNIRNAIEIVEIVPCDASVFGSNMAPLLMDTASYNGWNLNTSAYSSGTANWTITLPSDLHLTAVEYITVDMKQLGGMVTPLTLRVTIVKAVDSSTANYDYTFHADSTSASPGIYQNYALLNGTTYPKSRLGYTPLPMTSPDITGIAADDNILSISLISETDAENVTNVIINSISLITNHESGTLSYKFTNDSVRQAQSAQAIAALYAVLYNTSVSQTDANILTANALTGAGYVGTIDTGVYGSHDVLANYGRSIITYTHTSYALTTRETSTISAPTGNGGTADGGAYPATFAISPTLPTGMALNVNTGEITGTPTEITSDTNYTITASKNGTTAITTFKLVTTLDIDYDSSGISGDITTTETLSLVPTGTATGTSFTISPDLPTGISLDASTGEISGTPEVITASTTYTVSATANSSTDTHDITFSTPLSIKYDNISTTVDGVVTAPVAGVFSISGITYSIDTVLPTGLSLDANTGLISGTASATSSSTSYNVTATINNAVAATATFTIEVV